MKTGLRYGWTLLLAAILLTGCGAENNDAPPERPPVLITTAKVEARAVEEVERSLGRLESDVDPRVAAEVSGATGAGAGGGAAKAAISRRSCRCPVGQGSSCRATAPEGAVQR